MAKKPVMTPEEIRAEALNTALTTIERKHGQGAIMKLSDGSHANIAIIPSGSIGLDLALGIGRGFFMFGFPLCAHDSLSYFHRAETSTGRRFGGRVYSARTLRSTKKPARVLRCARV